MKELWQHQKEAVKRALESKEGAFAFLFEPGAGKTLTTVTTLRHVYSHHKRILRTLIICPRVVCEAWKREFLESSRIEEKNVTVLLQAGKKRRELMHQKILADPNRIFITNTEFTTIKEFYALIQVWEPEVIIVDESQRIKNISAKRTKAIIALGDSAKYRYILTGTPILNNPMDIFAQYRFLDKGRAFGKNFFIFRSKYFYDKNAGMPSHKYFPNWQPRQTLEDDFNNLIYKKGMRVLKKDCLDLPPLVKTVRYTELGPDQRRTYNEMLRGYVAFLNDKACTASLALTRSLRLQQILAGFFPETDEADGAIQRFSKNPRMDVLKELLEDELPAGAKVIIWTIFRDTYEPIRELCESLGRECRFVVGGMSAKEVQDGIDDFQNDPNVTVMIANQSAGGAGVTLTAASYSIYYTRSYSLEHDIQSEARNYRGGSEVHEKVTRIDIVAEGTIDEVVLGALSRKQSVADAILDSKNKLGKV